MAKHYIRLDEKGYVIKAFSTDFEQAEKGDICVKEDGGRHFNLELFGEDGHPAFKYANGKLVETVNADFDRTSMRELRYESAAIKAALSEGDWKIIRQISSSIHKMSDAEFVALTHERDAMRERLDEIKSMLEE